jgi:hypothetical protein
MLVQTVAAEARLRGIREVRTRAWCFNDVAHRALTQIGFRPQVVQFALKLDPYFVSSGMLGPSLPPAG